MLLLSTVGSSAHMGGGGGGGRVLAPCLHWQGPCYWAYLVACVPLRVVRQVDVAELHILVIFCHPGVVEASPAGDGQQLLMHVLADSPLHC